MKHIETPSKMHLQSVINKIADGAFVIPDFQRDFEWQPWDVVELIQSIFMDYYIGTLLLWKTDSSNIKALKCEPIYAFEGTQSPQHIVLDGQQRLTALHYAVFAPKKNYPGRKKRCSFLINIRHLLEQDFERAVYYEWVTQKISTLLEDTEMQFEQKIIPVSLIRDLWEFMEWVKGYEKYWKGKVAKAEEKLQLLMQDGSSDIAQIESLKQILNDGASTGDEASMLKCHFKDLLNNFFISYIELDRDIPISKVCDIFTRINSKGVALSIFDLLNAILRPHDIFLKEAWRESSESLKFTDASRMRIYVLQVMSILKQAYCSPAYLYYLVPQAKKTIREKDGTTNDIVLIPDSESFKAAWDEAVLSIQKVIKSLTNPRDYGAILPKFVPYPSIIPPLASITKYADSLPVSERAQVNGKIRKWYWASIFTNLGMQLTQPATTSCGGTIPDRGFGGVATTCCASL